MQLLAINQRQPDQFDVTVLFCLLSEREPHQNISHKKLPSYLEHEDFIRSCPYEFWYLIHTSRGIVGTVYLTRLREIGVSIFKRDRGNGFGAQAIEMLKQRHPGKFLANIAPSNLDSIAMFKQLGFKKIQSTYSYE
jgi:RimJ/RimL family protein N-acetyltransferase